jgi:serine/threonine-protein kinase OSR1/STK39
MLEDTRNEIKIMSCCHHPNVLNYYASFVNDKELWIIMPLIEGGSLRTVLNQLFPKGIHDEVLLASILL